MGLSELSFSATNINVGKDVDKPSTPKAGDLYVASDTNIIYVCYVDGVWVNNSPIASYTFATGYNDTHVIHSLSRSGYNPYDVSESFECLVNQNLGYALGKPYPNENYGKSYIYKNEVLIAKSNVAGGFTTGSISCAKGDIIRIRVLRIESATDGGNPTTVKLSSSRFTNIDIGGFIVREDTTASKPPIAEVLKAL